ncbi:MAG TPA: DUF6089 family protein [Chitinophagaceae bacterium]
MRVIFRTGTMMFMFCFVQNSPLHAQSFMNKLEFGLQAGTFIYQGDLTPARLGSFRTAGFQLGVSASMPLNNFLSVRANIAAGKLKGDDGAYNNPEWRKHRDLNFRSPVIEASALMVWDITGNVQRHTGLAPYLFGGMGLAFLRVRRDASGFDAEYFPAALDLPARVNADLEHATPRALFVLPVGAGVRYPLTERIALHAETSYRLSFNDYIDGFSEAGNTSLRDHYQSYSVGLFYRFNSNNTVKCPVIRP